MSAAELLKGELWTAAAAVRAGEVRARELTEAAIDALTSVGPTLNAVAGLDAEQALAAAERIDRSRAAGTDLPPLAGVPMAHKDMFYRAGRVCASGTRIRAGFVPGVTATALERLDAAGAIDLGRLNMVEFALGLTGHNDITGHPRNPWSTDHITGGSSSGPVAAVAARLVFAALGSDTGGSIRVPAACTGILGLKPTYGRVSRAGALPLSHTLDHVGPLGRSARDLALLMEAVAGVDRRDQTTSTTPVPAYSRLLERSPTRLRLGVAESPFELPLHAEVAGLYDAAVDRMRQAGLRASGLALPALDSLNVLRRVVMIAEAAARHEDFLEERRDAYNAYTLARLDPGFELAATTYLRAVGWRAEAVRRFVGEVFADADVLVLPAMAEPVPRLDATDTADMAGYVRRVNALGHFICPFNYLGLPALTMPMGRTANGLPMAIQLVAPPFGEARLLRLAHHLETNAGFRLGEPPIVTGRSGIG
ncbi:MAG TPA: amidase [Geminicoccaceae bacterium]|mgnify:CR=1 FL=1|jgi:aspartyl-tRNA(Asn)/glutamyl-tRNA(Gln) amidotransferase subunit A|nr:amidase [Geminicoccaceae bacterium]